MGIMEHQKGNCFFGHDISCIGCLEKDTCRNYEVNKPREDELCNVRYVKKK